MGSNPIGGSGKEKVFLLAERIILHIGPRKVLPGTEKWAPIRPGEKHICIDPLYAKEHVESPHRQVELRSGLGQKTGLTAASADVIHVHNVFEAEPESAGQTLEILKELRRVLSPNGIIHAVYTQGPVNITPEELVRLAREAGLQAHIVWKNDSGRFRKAFPNETRAMREVCGDWWADENYTHIAQGSFQARLYCI